MTSPCCRQNTLASSASLVISVPGVRKPWASIRVAWYGFDPLSAMSAVGLITRASATSIPVQQRLRHRRLVQVDQQVRREEGPLGPGVVDREHLRAGGGRQTHGACPHRLVHVADPSLPHHGHPYRVPERGRLLWCNEPRAR